MPNVKVIDAAAWAALPEIAVEENEDLAGKGIPSDTYRCIRSDVASAVVTQLTGVGPESASEVGTASILMEVSANGVESTSEVGSPTAAIVGVTAVGVESASEVGSPSEVTAGLPSGLVAQWEMDNTTVTATSWVDEVNSINLENGGYGTAPTINSGGMPSGLDYYDFATSGSYGLGDDVSASSLPDGDDSRTMAVVMRWKANEPNFQGVMYGTAATDQAFGITALNTDLPAVDVWGNSVSGSTSMDNSGWHVLIARYDTTSNTAYLYVDGTQEGSSAIGPLNTVLDDLTVCVSLNGGAKHGIDVAAILIWDNDVGASGASDIQTYLNDKYLVA